jgi:hypothetical protein
LRHWPSPVVGETYWSFGGRTPKLASDFLFDPSHSKSFVFTLVNYPLQLFPNCRSTLVSQQLQHDALWQDCFTDEEYLSSSLFG